MFFVDTTSGSSQPTGLGVADLGLKGKLFSTRTTANTQKTKPSAGNSLKDFCGLMGWTNPALLHDSSDKEMAIEPPPQDFLQLNMEKEAKQEFNTHSLELQHSLKPVSVRQKKKLNKEKRESSKGKEWFGMPATEMTDEVKADLEVLQMRSVLDPKHFYKKNDLKVLPKYFQVGKYEDSPLDYHQEKNIKKSKSKSIVEDLLKDAEFSRRVKQKYKDSLMHQKPKYYGGRGGKNKRKDGHGGDKKKKFGNKKNRK